MTAAEQSVAGAEFAVHSSEATLKEASENLVKTSVLAPMDGTISLLNVEKGERVVGTDLMSGTEILRVANLDRMEVLTEVNENDIVRVKLNDSAQIEVDAFPDRKFKGIVTEIANSATTTGVTTDQVTNFEVKILLLKDSYADLIKEGKPQPFRPGHVSFRGHHDRIQKAGNYGSPSVGHHACRFAGKIRFTGYRKSKT